MFADGIKELTMSVYHVPHRAKRFAAATIDRGKPRRATSYQFEVEALQVTSYRRLEDALEGTRPVDVVANRVDVAHSVGEG